MPSHACQLLSICTTVSPVVETSRSHIAGGFFCCVADA